MQVPGGSGEADLAATGTSVGGLVALKKMVSCAAITQATAEGMMAAAPWKSPQAVALHLAQDALRAVGRHDAPADVHLTAALAFAVADEARRELRTEEGDEAWRLAAVAVVVTAAEVLAEVPDRLVFHRARHVEQRLLDAHEDHSQRGAILATVGSARLVPFALSPAYAGYRQQMDGSWHHRHLLREGVTGERAFTPDARDALRAAADALARAVTLLDGRERARAQADLAHARLTQLYVEDDVDPRDIVRDCHEALPALSDAPFQQRQVAFILAKLGARGSLDRFLLDPAQLDAVIRHWGLRRAATAAVIAIQVGLAQHRALCRELRARMLARIPHDRLEPERRWLREAGAHLFEHDPFTCDDAASATLAESLPAGWTNTETAAGAIHILAHSESSDLGELRAALQAQGATALPGDVMRVMFGVRVRRWATSRAQDGDHTAAATSYIRAATAFARLHFSEWALDSLLGAYESLVGGDPDTAVEALDELRDVGDELTQELAGTGAVGVLRLLFGEAFTRLSEWVAPWGSREPEDGVEIAGKAPAGAIDSVLLAMQLAKGRPFSAVLRNAGAHDDDESAAAALRLATHLERDTVPRPDALLVASRYGDMADARPIVDEEAVLTAHWHASETEEGEGPFAMIVNLRQRYQQLDQTAMAKRVGSAGALYSDAQLAHAMPSDAVLAAFYYWGVSKPPFAGFHCLLRTRDAPAYMAVFDPRRRADVNLLSFVTPGIGDRRATAITTAEPSTQTAHARRCIVDEPLHGPASREAIDALAASAGHFRPVLDVLNREAAGGRKHLILWPHGPQYLFPFHLLPTTSGRIVADDWTVTVIPSLECVLSSRPESDKCGVLAVASPDGGVPYGLPPEPTVLQQARDVAEPFGSTPVAPATREQFRQCAQQARYVHLAAHGAFYRPAPLFHHVFLDDGPLFAHDVLRLDLRGVDLVTVSACESAVVRYDESDNLLGMPSAFLRAGAAAVIGALWPVDPDVATAFFATLYRLLAQGQCKLAAFRRAQLDARAHFPQLRDWGAFCMLGDWR